MGSQIFKGTQGVVRGEPSRVQRHVAKPAVQAATGSQAATTSDELVRWRAMDALQTLRIVADYVKEDATYKPTRSLSTRRVHVTAAGADWELFVDGPKFYDTRARKGGGGAIDLVIHLWRTPFKTAVTMLRRSGT